MPTPMMIFGVGSITIPWYQLRIGIRSKRCALNKSCSRHAVCACVRHPRSTTNFDKSTGSQIMFQHLQQFCPTRLLKSNQTFKKASISPSGLRRFWKRGSWSIICQDNSLSSWGISGQGQYEQNSENATHFSSIGRTGRGTGGGHAHGMLCESSGCLLVLWLERTWP